MPENFKQRVFHGIESIIGRERADDISRKFFSRNPGFDLESVNRHHRERHGVTSEIPPNELIESIFSIYYGRADAQSIVPTVDTPASRSFIPYTKGATSAIVFNFFRMNYGIRDPILYRISIIHDETVYFSSQFLLPGNGVKLVQDPATEASSEDLPANGILLVEAFHPRIRTRMNELRYFGLYAGSGSICGVHSFYFNTGRFVEFNHPGTRAFGPKTKTAEYYDHFGRVNDLTTDAAHGLGHFRASLPTLAPGFVGVRSALRALSAVWHDNIAGTLVPPANAPEEKERCVQALYIPNFKLNAPLLLAHEREIGYRPNKMTLTLRNSSGGLLGEVHHEQGRAVDTIDTRRLFSGLDFDGPAFLYIDLGRDVGDFQSRPVNFLQIYYTCGDGLADQVHSHMTFGVHNDVDSKNRSYRCRKFAPYIRDENYRWEYSLVNFSGGPANKDADVSVRVMTDTGREAVFSHSLPTQGIGVIKGDSIVNAVEGDISKCAIVQIEHETTNYNGSWHVTDIRSGHVGTDHFSGG